MNILLTAIQLVLCLGAVLAYTRAEKERDRCNDHLRTCEAIAMKLRGERDRVTVLEREVDALRRELRKLGGKFYASQREEPYPKSETDLASDPKLLVPVCDNYSVAQRDGPKSPAASCECDYCTRRRREKSEFRERQAAKGHLDPRWIAAHTSGTGNHGE